MDLICKRTDTTYRKILAYKSQEFLGNRHFYACFHWSTAFIFAPGFVTYSTIHIIYGCITVVGKITHRIPAITNCSHQRCSVKKVFLEISQNSQENTCARVSFLIKLQAASATLLKKRLWHRCFPVNFAKFLRTLFTERVWATASATGSFDFVGSREYGCKPNFSKSVILSVSGTVPDEYRDSLEDILPNKMIKKWTWWYIAYSTVLKRERNIPYMTSWNFVISRKIRFIQTKIMECCRYFFPIMMGSISVFVWLKVDFGIDV